MYISMCVRVCIGVRTRAYWPSGGFDVEPYRDMFYRDKPGGGGGGLVPKNTHVTRFRFCEVI